MAFSDTCNDQLDSPLDCMGFLYMTMGAADGHLDENEMMETCNTLGEWPDVSVDDIAQSIMNATGVMQAVKNEDDIPTALSHCCMVLKNGMTEKARQAVLSDLARIAQADGEISDGEGRYFMIVKTGLGIEA